MLERSFGKNLGINFTCQRFKIYCKKLHSHSNVTLPSGIIWSNGENWKEVRQYILKNIKEIGVSNMMFMESFILDELKHFMPYFDNLVQQQHGLIYVNRLFSLLTLNLTLSMIAGIRFSYDDQVFLELMKASGDMNKIIRPGISLLSIFPPARHIPHLTEHDKIMEVHSGLQTLFKVS